MILLLYCTVWLMMYIVCLLTLLIPVKAAEQLKMGKGGMHDPGSRNCAMFVRYICTQYQQFRASLPECSTEITVQ